MKLLLVTLHAKYVHASLALPSLAAACADLPDTEFAIREFTVNEPADGVLRRMVAEEAGLVAFSCYIWNIEATLKLVADLKQLRPGTIIVLGGPEASHGVFELMERNPAVDMVIRGEGEVTFREALQALDGGVSWEAAASRLSEVEGITVRTDGELVANPERGPVADLDTLPSPFAAGLADLTKPLVYYETSRGCPFSCAFCMSSLEKGVRSYSPGRIEADLDILMAAGVRTVKLVDRTFNYDAVRANRIWEYILDHNRESAFHFEIAADLLTDANIEFLKRVPAGRFRFEIGVQAEGAETLARVGRSSDLTRLFANVRRLVAETAVTVHLDLVAGLPHEDFNGFLRSLQQVFDLLSFDNSYFFDCQGGKEEATEAYRAVRREASDAANAGRREKTDCHVQVEPLKVLKGSPMRAIAREEGYRFSATPPYKILTTPWLTYGEIGRIETIARLLDLVYNSGRFATPLAAWGKTTSPARIFAAMAEFWEREDISLTLSQPDLFAAFWSCAEALAPQEVREDIRDALCYDLCLTDYPGGRELGFFTKEEVRARRNEEKEIALELVQRRGGDAAGRVRWISRRFARDYRRTPWREGEIDLLFVYVSAPGKGLSVEIAEIGQPGMAEDT
ncbi:B12-binding domain-containing radical SAM protein [Geobacter sp. AOG1]|uniref:B12-binding domain-containing radical SAM protein n=1 Tax=Geobacter sp. AOG1 TaxID=1566346 RepID=UPI001CC7FE1E|nr:B12-binding domain-containing radical SAM protein [Geobacter sp. AOG1]GFE57690.1 B12-binding domain-containing radical SAM protein [Geobacter sp. AOG1]